MEADSKSLTLGAPATLSRQSWLLLSPSALVGIFLLWVALTLSVFRLHGFSLACWHSLLDRSAPAEVKLNEAEAIRSDEWLVILPMTFAQLRHRPSFPSVNTLYAMHPMNAAVSFPVPVKSWLAAFRPYHWGYFVGGADFGMAWQWWFRLLLLFYAVFLLGQRLTGGRAGLSLLGGLCIVFSTFFQFWSFDREPMLSWAILAALEIDLLLASRGWKKLFLHSAALAWLGVAFCFGALYPAFQICAAYFALALAMGFACERWREGGGGIDRLGRKLGGAGVALAVTGAFLALYAIQNSADLQTMMNTVYPGRRFETGGKLGWTRVFIHDFAIQAMKLGGWGFLGNICEAAGYILFFPLTLGLLAWAGMKRRRVSPVAAAVALYLAFMIAWMELGFPAWLARVTLMSKVPAVRAVYGLGIADLCLLWCCFGSWPSGSAAAARRARIVAGALWAICCILLAAKVRQHFPIAPHMVAISGLITLAVGVLLAWGRAEALALLAVANFVGTAWFNPVAQGGYEYILGNPVSRRVLEIDRQRDSATTWAFFEGVQGNLFRMLGVRSVNGAYFYPPLKRWQEIDPEGKYGQAYNRSAHICFFGAGESEPPRMEVQPGDMIRFHVSPDHPRFLALGATHLMVGEGNPLPYAHLRHWKEITGAQGFRIFERADE